MSEPQYTIFKASEVSAPCRVVPLHEVEAMAAEIERLKQENADLCKHELLASGYHQRTEREIEIASALEDTPIEDRDSADIAISELLDLVDAGRNRVLLAEDQLSAARAALQELVELKDIKARIEGWEVGSTQELASLADDYSARKPLAWEAARAIVTGQALAQSGRAEAKPRPLDAFWLLTHVATEWADDSTTALGEEPILDGDFVKALRVVEWPEGWNAPTPAL